MTETTTTTTAFDAIVIGAGFAGIYQLHKLRNELGLTVRAFEKGSGVGGTWFWNRYPGAMSDTESFVYRYSFDDELLQEWDWESRYLDQPDILRYLDAVVDRYDLRRDIQLDTRIDSLVFDDETSTWTATTDSGEQHTARYVVTALGLLAATNTPDIPGMERFEGRMVHTSQWPDDLQLEGKRVGVIGTGSTGTQFIVAASKQAEHLTVFQRSPQYSVPSGNRPVTPVEVADAKAQFPATWQQVKDSVVAFGFEESTVAAMDVSEEERERGFREAWDRGNGFYFMFGAFNDIAIDERANEAAAAFIRGKIAEIVKDPETARKLTPTDLYAKRPLCNSNYYDVYNRDNVSLVSIKETPIVEITSKGIKTSDGAEHELDVIVFATGFDAVDGNYLRMDLRGSGGRTIQEHWKDGAKSYLGVATAGFPNMFMILGPNGPFTNLVPSIEVQVEWISDLIGVAQEQGADRVEATEEAEAAWTTTCEEIANFTLFPKVDSWIFGANIPGKPKTVMFYMAGIGAYRQQLAEVEAERYKGLRIERAAVSAAA